MIVRHGDVWKRNATTANIIGYSPKTEMFDMRGGHAIARHILLTKFTRETRGTGRILWEGSQSA